MAAAAAAVGLRVAERLVMEKGFGGEHWAVGGCPQVCNRIQEEDRRMGKSGA